LRVSLSLPVIASILILGLMGFSENAGALPFDVAIPLVNPNTSGSEQFGFAVDVGPNFVVVGNPSDSEVIDSVGIVFVYDFNGNLIHTLQNPNPSAIVGFGHSLEVDNNLVLIGARNGFEVLLYDLDSGTLPIQTFQDPSGFGLTIGRSVAMDGNNILIQYSIFEQTILFDKTTGNSILQFESGIHFFLPGEFRYPVDIEGNFVAISIPEDVNLGTPSQVSIYDISSCDANNDQVFKNEEKLFTLTDSQTGGAITNSFGEDISISNNFIVVGDGAEIHIFDLTDGSFVHSVGQSLPAVFGHSVSLEGSRLMTGGLISFPASLFNDAITEPEVGGPINLVGATTGGGTFSYVAQDGDKLVNTLFYTIIL